VRHSLTTDRHPLALGYPLLELLLEARDPRIQALEDMQQIGCPLRVAGRLRSGSVGTRWTGRAHRSHRPRLAWRAGGTCVSRLSRRAFEPSGSRRAHHSHAARFAVRAGRCLFASFAFRARDARRSLEPSRALQSGRSCWAESADIPYLALRARRARGAGRPSIALRARNTGRSFCPPHSLRAGNADGATFATLPGVAASASRAWRTGSASRAALAL
jgi:hypothetical protein